SDRISAVCFHPDGRRGLTASADGTAILWDLESKKQLRTFYGHEEGLAGAAFALGGSHLITVSDDHTAMLWDIKQDRAVRVFREHSEIDAVAVHGEHFLTASKNTLRL